MEMMHGYLDNHSFQKDGTFTSPSHHDGYLLRTKSRTQNRLKTIISYESGVKLLMTLGLTGVMLLLVFFCIVLHHQPAATFILDDEDFFRLHFQRTGSSQREISALSKPGHLVRTNPFYEKKRQLPSNFQGPVDIDVSSIGDKSSWYENLLERYKSKWIPDGDNASLQKFIEEVRAKHRTEYKQHPVAAADFAETSGNVNCPLFPPLGYPKAWRIMDIIDNWNPDDTDPEIKERSIYQGICKFDFNTEKQKIENYRRAELPFVIRNDPQVHRTVERWNNPTYLGELLGEERHRTEISHSNHFMYWSIPRAKRRGMKHDEKPKMPPGWKEPTESMAMSFGEWLSHANVADINNEQDHWYFRLIGCGSFRNCDAHSSEFLFDELPFFKPMPNREEGLYVVEGAGQKGIHCRFGMRGTIAENHWDGSRNMVALLAGARRYILSHPNQCSKLSMLPIGHPSGRHSDVDWSNPHEKLDKYPEFKEALGNEIVLLPGEVLYMPTMWFHYIVSLDTVNIQCNTRSGITHHYIPDIQNCGQM